MLTPVSGDSHVTRGAAVLLVLLSVSVPATTSRAGELEDHLALLAQHGVLAETGGLVGYLERLQPNERLQGEIEKLVEELASEDFNVREAAFKELPTFGEAARGKLTEALKSKDPEVSWRAGKVLKALDSNDQTQTRQALTQAALTVLKARGEAEAAPAILATIAVLTDESTRDTAYEALWASVDASHVALLTKSLQAKSLHERAAAAVALEVAAADARPEAATRALAAIRALLRDESPVIRLAAARALIDRDAKAAVAVLVDLANEEVQDVLWQADALLHLKTGQRVEPAEKQTLGEAWRQWGDEQLAKAELNAALGKQRLELSAGRNVVEESFAVDQASLAKGYGRFQFEADNNGTARVANGKLRIDGRSGEGDQRLFLTSRRMIGRDRWPDKLEVRAKLGGEEGNNYGWHLGVSVGRVKVLFHPGESRGYFRAETTDEHDNIFANEGLSFAPATGVMHEMIVRVAKTKSGAEFEVVVNDANGGPSYKKVFTVTQEQLGDYNRIGLERSGRPGGDAMFDSVSIRLGR